MKSMSLLQKVFLIIGAVMISMTLYMASNTSDYIDNSIVSVGKVVDYREVYSSSSLTYAPIIEYQIPNGKTLSFASSTSSYPPAYDIGDPVNIRYATGSPQNAMINGFFSLWLGEIIVGGLGCVFLGIAFFGNVFNFFKNRKRTSLTLYGDRIDTKLQGVERNLSLRVNGRHPYNIVTQGLNSRTSERQTFKSQNLWVDPTAYLDDRWITVYVDKRRPKRYFMDVSFLSNG
ncbi:DUF3592 domain-containing protein [Shewanella surugensis]|uniref:DUF3592 domain-containing protein n=1 Tax=Shewanella surugensis TaxID=212020 RepID=A0ABT0L6W1_9GAMM|nr:DUF3592 domain-containing protein [Shewanella surugensis]MCL1123427.1 DUF3592 domain-containing protein [Shewanella surugensis]